MAETAYETLRNICLNLKKHTKGKINYKNDEGQDLIEVVIDNCDPVLFSQHGIYGSSENVGQMALDLLAVSGDLNMNISLQMLEPFDINSNVDSASLELKCCGFYSENTH